MSQRRLWQAVAVVAALAVASVAGAQSDEGVKQVERLVKASGNTVKAIADTKLQLQKTMDVYNSLFAEDAKDLKKLYSNLQKEMENTDKRRAKISEEAEKMNAEAATLFKEWTDSAQTIENPDLRKRSEDRLSHTKSSFAEIGTVGQKAADLYGPFMKSLQDQVAYLATDLNPSSLSSLKPDATKLNDKANALIKSIDNTITTANSNIGELRPR